MTENNSENAVRHANLNEIASIVMHAAQADTLEQVLQRIAHASREFVGARYAALGVPDGYGGLRYFKVSGISEEQIAEIEHPPVGAGLLGVIMNERKTLRLPVMQDDPRAVGFPPGHPPMKSLLGVPVQIGQQLFGMLYLTDREDEQDFTLEDQWLVETMAGFAALAIAGSHLREQQQRLALLEERQRIGMELHDGVIQSLYAVGMHLDLMRTSGEIKPHHLGLAIDGLNQVIEDIRQYIMGLKTLGYSQKTLRESIEDVVARLYIPEDLTIEIDAPEKPPPLSSEVLESVCLIAGEALSNAVRHAGAAHVEIRCREEKSDFQLVISDDGRGFDTEQLQQDNGLGLRNMTKRARLYGGSVEINSQPGNGTKLIIRMPMEH